MYGFTFLYIFYWILRAVFPNIYLGSNIAVMHPHNIYPQIMMGLSSIWGYYYIFKNLDVIRRYKSFNFLFRIIFIYVVWGLYYYFENLNFTELTDIIKTISPFTLFFVFYIGLHKDGKKTWYWLKLLRFIKNKQNKWVPIVRGGSSTGDLGFPSGIGTGIFEKYEKDTAPSLRVDPSKESIIPQKKKIAPQTQPQNLQSGLTQPDKIDQETQ